MKLTILNVGSGDDGIYKCVAKNPRGETDGIIRLYGNKKKNKKKKNCHFIIDLRPWACRMQKLP